MTDYAHPEVLVTTDWVREHRDDATVKIIEIDVDTSSYDTGHIPGAIGFNWQSQLQDQIRRDIIGKDEFAELIGGAGILPGDTVVVYGDNNNWFAAYGFWLFKLYGHDDVRLMDGGRVKWLKQDGDLSTDKPAVTAVIYPITKVANEYRAMLPEVMDASSAGTGNLVDVRSPDEFTGKIIAPPNLPETAQRGGHIPGATNVPWSTAVNTDDGTFKTADELRSIYIDLAGVDPDKPTIAYCRIGERSSHTWFVLKYLLGVPDVKNYDGSWTEYGNLIAAPIER